MKKTFIARKSIYIFLGLFLLQLAGCGSSGYGSLSRISPIKGYHRPEYPMVPGLTIAVLPFFDGRSFRNARSDKEMDLADLSRNKIVEMLKDPVLEKDKIDSLEKNAIHRPAKVLMPEVSVLPPYTTAQAAALGRAVGANFILDGQVYECMVNRKILVGPRAGLLIRVVDCNSGQIVFYGDDYSQAVTVIGSRFSELENAARRLIFHFESNTFVSSTVPRPGKAPILVLPMQEVLYKENYLHPTGGTLSCTAILHFELENALGLPTVTPAVADLGYDDLASVERAIELGRTAEAKYVMRSQLTSFRRSRSHATTPMDTTSSIMFVLTSAIAEMSVFSINIEVYDVATKRLVFSAERRSRSKLQVRLEDNFRRIIRPLFEEMQLSLSMQSSQEMTPVIWEKTPTDRLPSMLQLAQQHYLTAIGTPRVDKAHAVLLKVQQQGDRYKTYSDESSQEGAWQKKPSELKKKQSGVEEDTDEDITEDNNDEKKTVVDRTMVKRTTKSWRDATTETINTNEEKNEEKREGLLDLLKTMP